MLICSSLSWKVNYTFQQFNFIYNKFGRYNLYKGQRFGGGEGSIMAIGLRT